MPNRGRTVLLVEDEPQGRDVLTDYLTAAGFTVAVATSRAEGQAAIVDPECSLDLVLLDLTLPDGDGLSILRYLRATGSAVPVIVISARGREPDRVTGLITGADDYIPKPASPREVVARAVAVLRRSDPAADRDTPARLVFGSLAIDPVGRVATCDDRPLDLAPKEFELLLVMATQPGRAFTRAELLAEAWGSQPDWQDPGTVTVHIRRLRQKIESDPANPEHLVTVYGHGYRFDA